ncbi:transcription factor LHW-like isoform X2 [Coffea arabica]|uniref:Transcription factor LHW-like isoform X2 n=1 Tax=Coffea arabica TaxID=13443 RepID=A0ABM4WHN4_COFAR
MGSLLKEALKTLCGVNQWSYAVFWKIGCQNPKLLIWEECYYEPVIYATGLPRNSGIEGFENWNSAEACNSQLGVGAGNELHLLVNKMMMENQVNVLGEGLVGRAAFTGSHQWILSENYRRDAHPLEVLKEVVQQFSAGMQTIAVIPVLPHGVVQLGSCMPIMENVAFVNDVKTLVLQLGCVPRILLSESYATKEPAPKLGIPVCPGSSFMRNCSESSDMYASTPFIANSCDFKTNLTQMEACLAQTSGAIGQVQGIDHPSVAMFQASDFCRSPLASHVEQYQAKIGPSANTNSSSTGQLANGVAKAEVMCSNPEVSLNQQSSLCIPRPTFNFQPAIGSSDINRGSLKLLEQQILSNNSFQNHMDKSFNVSNNMMMSILRANAGLVSSSSQDSVTCQSANVGESYGGVKSNRISVSTMGSLSDADLLSCNSNSGAHNVSDSQIANSSKLEGSLSKAVDCSSACKLLTNNSASGYPSADNKLIGIHLVDVNDRVVNDLHQAFSAQLSQQSDNTCLSECNPSLIPKDEKHGNGVQSLTLGEALYGDGCAQNPSGDDLFDILGVDFRNKLLNCGWNNSQNSTCDSSITYLDKNSSVWFKGSDASTDLYPVNQGQSESSIFSGASNDHLLDAVISSIQPSGKLNMDDSVSCRTMLTNTSSSSAPNASRPCSMVSLSGQMQGDLFAFPKSMTKPGSLGSYSLRSGPGKDDKGGYSNSGSICGSQISSWIEHQDVKPSSSVSTAYSKKPDEMTKTNRKRLKPGENPRPRPKDRQMIQDRVKELREIVPNGAKCSIDALLERTIKHMLFLQSVTKHADKLKHTGDFKILGKEGGLLIKDNYDGGVTWAYELGSQSMVCPIIVEDLNQHRQMLVEMLCEERGLFLEIADIIRGLGLTILKGIMETRNEKIWARFAVEANRDVTRTDIFIALVRLLEQTTKNGATLANCIESESMMVPQFQQATSIPASGRPCDLQ